LSSFEKNIFPHVILITFLFKFDHQLSFSIFLSNWNKTSAFNPFRSMTRVAHFFFKKKTCLWHLNVIFYAKKIVQTCSEARTPRLVISTCFLKYVSLTLTHIKNKMDFLYFILSCTSLLSKIMSLSPVLYCLFYLYYLYFIFSR